MLVMIEETATQYLDTILSSNLPTFTKAAVTDDISGSIMMYGSVVGVYFTSASYDAAKVLVKSLNKEAFSSELMMEYIVPEIKELIDNDPLFNAYCVYMMNSDDSLDQRTKESLKTLLK